jgi:hypothetical protein
MTARRAVMNLWVLLAAVVVIGALYIVGPIVFTAYRSYRKPLTVQCPAANAEARVKVDPVHAGVAAAFGSRSLRVTNCSFWPQRELCNRQCTSRIPEQDAVETANVS